MPRAQTVKHEVDPGPSPWAYLIELRHYATADDDPRFIRALGGLWNECALYEAPVRSWRDLAAAPVGCCPSAITGEELALFIGLMAGVLMDFAPPPPRKRTKKNAPAA